MTFIKQEALEKEIRVKADEEFAIEKGEGARGVNSGSLIRPIRPGYIGQAH